MAREVNEYGFEIFKGGHGRKENQKLKTFLVLQYLMRESDESHVVSAKDIVGYLQQECGIDAERRSIYKDIEEINKAMLIVEDEISVDEAEERLAENEDEKTVVYDKNKKSFMFAIDASTCLIFVFWQSASILRSLLKRDRRNGWSMLLQASSVKRRERISGTTHF